MTTVERAGETLVRRMDRNNFLRRSATAVFGFAVAAAVEGIFAPRALANNCQITQNTMACSPFHGNWCANIGGSCIGGNCDTRVCQYDFSDWKITACWCTTTHCYECGTPNNYCGFWHCCDCDCNGTGCGCRGFNYTCTQAAAPKGSSPEVFRCC